MMNTNSTRTEELLELIQNADNGYDKVKGDLKVFERVFFNEIDAQVYESLEKRGMSRLAFPKARSKCARASDSLNRTYFSNDKFATISPDDDENREEYLYAIDKLHEATNTYIKDMNIFMCLQPNIRKTPYIGTAVAKSYWDNGKPVIESVNIDEIRFDRDAKTPESSTYFVHLIYKTQKEINNLIQREIFNLDEVSTGIFNEFDKITSKRIELKEIYTLDDGKWHVSTFYKNAPLRQDVYLEDGCPITFGGLLPQLKRIDENEVVMCYYEPLIMPLVPLQEEYNIRRNQGIDAVKRFLNPKIVSSSTSGINPLDILNPNKTVIKGTNINAASIVPLPTPNLQPAILDTQNMDHDMSEVSGISPMMNGLSNDKSKTATEKGIEHSEGSIKLDSYVRAFNETFFNPLIKRVSMLTWKYGDAKLFKGVDRRLNLNYKVNFNTGLGVTNDVVKRENLGQAYSMMSDLLKIQVQLQDADAINTAKGLKKVVAETLPLIGITNSDELLGKENKQDEITESRRTTTSVLGAIGRA